MKMGGGRGAGGRGLSERLRERSGCFGSNIIFFKYMGLLKLTCSAKTSFGKYYGYITGPIIVK